MSHDDLNPIADMKLIRELHQERLLNDKAFATAHSLLQPASSWISWARRMLLLLGSILVLSGIMFFFAYNWSAMGPFLKLGLIESALLGITIAGYIRGRDTLSGQVLLMSGSILVGVLLAVYGQTYQTGADTYELFLGWALLIVGWVLLAKSSALWFFWLILLNTAGILYWQQEVNPSKELPYELLCFGLAALNGAALVTLELIARKGNPWLKVRLLRSGILAAVLLSLTVPTFYFILTPHSNWASFPVTLAWAGVIAGGYFYFRYKMPDMRPLALLTFSACVVLLTAIGKLIFHSHGNEPVNFLIFALLIAGVASGSAFGLRKITFTLAQQKEGITE